MSIEENNAIARRWNDEIYDKGSLAAIDELFATNFVWHYAPPGVAPDREGYKQENVTNLRASFADIQCTIEDMVAEEDKVAVRWTWHGTHTGEFWGIAPTGKQVTITGINVLRIVGGKIVEEWGESDFLGFMQQLGAKVG
ncbi:MAG: ester cyclase [Dehalococcoidia bacterium]|nr:MAG: ester cyclase [Dehalococcoidia bacterium]